MTRDSVFETAFVTEELPGDWERLTKPLAYRSACLQQKIVVPQGFVTDGPSVPRLPVAYWIAGDRADRASCLHDYLYRYHLDLGRKKADLVFYEAMRATNYSWLFAQNNYWWVRAMGWRAYGEHEGELDPR